MRRYIIYSRVSTSYQDTQAQIAECRYYVNSTKDVDDEVVYFDEEEMTTRYAMEDRPQLMAMLEFVRKGDILVIYSLDRLARTDDELVYIYKECLRRKGIIVYSLMQPALDPDDIALHAWLGQKERKNASVRTKNNLKYKQDSMEKVGTLWYGFKLDETILQTRERTRTFGKPYKLLPDPHEYRLCLLMIEMRQQKHTYEEIAQYLNDQGYRMRGGQLWLRASVHRIVKRANRYDPDLLPKGYNPSRESTLQCVG